MTDCKLLMEKLHDAAETQIGMWHKENKECIEKAIAAITDLLARAEAAEARAEKAEKERDDLFRILNNICKDVRAKCEKNSVKRRNERGTVDR